MLEIVQGFHARFDIKFKLRNSIYQITLMSIINFIT